MAIIESAVSTAQDDTSMPGSPAPARGVVVGFDRRGRPVVRKGTRRIEEIAAELRRQTPQPRLDLPRSVDIVRAMRDSR